MCIKFRLQKRQTKYEITYLYLIIEIIIDFSSIFKIDVKEIYIYIIFNRIK